MTRRTANSAFSLIEAAIASIIVGGVLVASLNVIGAAAATDRRMNDQDRATLLARDLMSEIMMLPYADPDTGAGATLGPESGEVTGTRSQFDDADDYHGWEASPVQLTDGTLIAGFSKWSRSVTCRRLNPTTLDIVAVDSGVLEVTVTVRRSDTTLASIVALRTNSWSGP